MSNSRYKEWLLRNDIPSYLEGICSLAIAVIGTVTTIVSATISGVWVVVTCVLGLLVAYAVWLRKSLSRPYKELASDLDSANQKISELTERLGLQKVGFAEDVKNLLGTLCQQTGLDSVNDRVSLFVSKVQDIDELDLLGRWSNNAEFNKKFSYTYSRNEGCLGIAWRKIVCDIPTLPDPIKNPKLYAQVLTEKYGMSLERATTLRMKSRRIYAMRIDDSRHNFVGVIVFESLIPSRIVSRTVEKVITDHYPQIREQLRSARANIFEVPK